MRILILCTGNSCRSQMAEGVLRSLNPEMEIFSAGTKPEKKVNPNAVTVMREINMDISSHEPTSVEAYIHQSFDFVITVCNNAKESCPVFTGKVKNRLHIGFDDPADATGTQEEVLSVYRKTRDLIKEEFTKFYNTEIKNQMENNEHLKEIVKEKYSKIANQSKVKNETSCCGSTGCCGEIDYTVFSEKYDTLKGYNSEADLGLGCGLPTEFAAIKNGNHVLDLGSGAGNDCFVAHALVGKTGQVTGLDFTDVMIKKAIKNKEKLGFRNIDFIKGDIENMPFENQMFDVVISNCVLNLVPDKQKAFSEIFRVLKNGGHFCVSDVVIKGELPEKLKNDAEIYAGCVSGAITINEYLAVIEQNNFKNTHVQKEKKIDIPFEILLNYLSLDEIEEFKNNKIGIFSITVSADKI